MHTTGEPSLLGGLGIDPTPQPANADPREVAFCRYVLLQDCRHFNLLCGSGDPATRAWERANGPEIDCLERKYPEFPVRMTQYVLLRAQARLRAVGGAIVAGLRR